MRILHLLSQRPSRTGSGVTLLALTRELGKLGFEQQAVIGVPTDDPHPEVAPLSQAQVHPLRFGPGGDLDFPLPGMSDVMPYESSVWSTLDEQQITQYEQAFRAHLEKVIRAFKPDLIHSHHVWLMSSLVKEIAPHILQTVHCHATGLRQMELCPHLAPRVSARIKQADGFAVLHSGHSESLINKLQVPADKIHVIGAGFEDHLFKIESQADLSAPPSSFVYIGKLSKAKGTPWLLEAFAAIRDAHPHVTLELVGPAIGEEGQEIQQAALQIEGVNLHGGVPLTELPSILNRSRVIVLPSFYEGLPLVIVQGLACGVHAVVTDLPGVREALVGAFPHKLRTVALPRIQGVDVPVEADLPAFVDNLQAAMIAQLQIAEAETTRTQPPALKDFTWAGIAEKLQAIWRALGAS